MERLIFTGLFNKARKIFISYIKTDILNRSSILKRILFQLHNNVSSEKCKF